jgi:DNA invertase Pin-like site-specific DNA recombinase
MNRYIGLARVSGREQEQEGFSLDVQEAGMHEYAKKQGGEIVGTFRITETATKSEERKIFREFLAYAKRHADELDGILFYKYDRAARNLKDFMLLEEIESDYGLPFVSVTQPVQNTPTGRMLRRMLATFAAFQTDQQALDIREGIAKRVETGWFPSVPPYGYRNARRGGRGIVEVHPENSIKVVRICELRASERLLVEQIVERLFQEGLFYSPSKPRFSPSKVYAILHDRSYLGFINFRGEWHPGLHEPLISQRLWDDVQISFGKQIYRSHEMVYASELIRCGACGHPITGEEKEKQTKAGPKTYVYYRCARYQRPGHPKIRLRESELDAQVLKMLADFRVENVEVQNWMVKVARARLGAEHEESFIRTEEVRRQLSLIRGQRDELLNLRLAKSISDDGFARKQEELDERERLLNRQLEASAVFQAESELLASRAPAIFSNILDNWPTLERSTRHSILRILFGGLTLNDRTLVVSNRTPLELFRAA